MKKTYLLLLNFILILSLVGCAEKEKSVSKNESKMEMAEEVDVKEDNTKKFEEIDVSSVTSEDLISVKAENSFATKCQTVEEIYEKSPYIVKGVVKETYFTVLEGMPYTVVDFETKEVLKGDLKENSVNTVLLYGGYMTVQQEVDYYKDASKFEQIKKEKWGSTYIEKRLTDAEYPKEGDEYVMSLMDNELSEGTYVPVNEFETVFKKGNGKYMRTLPSEEYFGDGRSKSDTYIENDKSFKFDWFSKKCKSLKKR